MLKKIGINLLPRVLPIFLFFFIWIPIIDHYYVSTDTISDETVNKARFIPDDSILVEIRRFFEPLENVDGKQLVASAEKILQRDIAIPGYSARKLGIPFNADDIDKGPVGWQLSLASFEVPNILLRAYEVTGRDDFLMTAKDIIQGWALYERKAWLPKGFLWNDHAVAARISVLAKFWKYYRNHKNYEEEVAEVIFQLVARSGKFLAKPSHFTFPTNHGIMQNLALLQICIAFPTLPDVEQYKQLAFNRLRDQMTFYINDEGVVLEHSSAYHKWGMEFIRAAFRYLTLMNVDIPGDWKEKYEKAKDFYAQLRRPDGSLPMFGDTDDDRDPKCLFMTGVDANVQSAVVDYKKRCIPKHLKSLYPVAGYSIWWDGLGEWPGEQKLNQTVVIWSYFPGHAHKHADEMSVLLWAGGQTWWTNVGYWPYGTDGRSEAVSWNGSNAPHLIDEDTKSIRKTNLLFYGWTDNLAVIDLERRGPKGYIARRQVVHMKPNLWIVVDNTYGDTNSRTTTTWTTSHNVTLSKGEFPGSYDLKGEGSAVSLKTSIIASENTEISQYKGSLKPFAGWEINKPASAIVVEQPANNSWAVATWALKNAVTPISEFIGKPSMQNWEGPGAWKIVQPVETGLLSIWRKGKDVYVNGGVRNEGTKKVTLTEAPAPSDKHAEILAGYESAARKYPKFNDLLSYRWKATYFLVFIFVMQEVFFLIYKKMKGKYATNLRLLSVLGWIIVIGAWLGNIYYNFSLYKIYSYLSH
jgi:hypothetical protein